MAGPGKRSHIRTRCQSKSQSSWDLIMELDHWPWQSCWSLVTATAAARLIANKAPQDSVGVVLVLASAAGGQQPGVQLGKHQTRSGQPSCVTSPQSEFPREARSKYPCRQCHTCSRHYHWHRQPAKGRQPLPLTLYSRLLISGS